MKWTYTAFPKHWRKISLRIANATWVFGLTLSGGPVFSAPDQGIINLSVNIEAYTVKF